MLPPLLSTYAGYQILTGDRRNEPAMGGMASLGVAAEPRGGEGSILHNRAANPAAIGSRSQAEIIESATERMVVIVIESRAFLRGCMVQGLRSVNPHIDVFGSASVGDWSERRSEAPNASIILISAHSRDDLRSTVTEACKAIASMERAPAVVVLSNEDDPAEILSFLDAGAKGVIPTDVSLNVAIEAIRLIRAGGLFVPASSLLSSRRSLEESKEPMRTRGSSLLTDRQAAVIEAVKKGKPNKIIAHELNMRESTVKVHIRNIMHKLNARNRTEVAYLYSGSTSEEEKR